MLQLGLLFLLLTAPLVDRDRPADPGEQLSDQAWFEPCAEAKRIATQGPCLRAEDCGALRSWKRLFGAPRLEPLEPQFAVRASRDHAPASYLCLAKAAPQAQRAPPR